MTEVAVATARLAAAQDNARTCLKPPCGNCRTGVELAQQALRAAQAKAEGPKHSGASTPAHNDGAEPTP